MDLTAQSDSVNNVDRQAGAADMIIHSKDAEGITMEMISAGIAAYEEFDPEREDPEALVFAIIYRAFQIAKENREAIRRVSRGE